ncbi:MAG: type II 3-dehydroquinate dehydratase [Culturomica sp.]|jgi:3-dehydroquinate dehydratase-2|nr:type II 3-dehydroquinate dehydratase [Culturomica sp.]
MKILILNGPNLNLLGVREPAVYGSLSFPDYLERLRKAYPAVEIDYFQSNAEGELIDKLHEAGFDRDGIVLNPGGYAHTSVALRDAVSAIRTPVIEVHISNIAGREDFRRISLTAPVCRGAITGLGLNSYRLAVEAFLSESLK